MLLQFLDECTDHTIIECLHVKLTCPRCRKSFPLTHQPINYDTFLDVLILTLHASFISSNVDGTLSRLHIGMAAAVTTVTQ